MSVNVFHNFKKWNSIGAMPLRLLVTTPLRLLLFLAAVFNLAAVGSNVCPVVISEKNITNKGHSYHYIYKQRIVNETCSSIYKGVLKHRMLKGHVRMSF